MELSQHYPQLPDELITGGETFSNTVDIATKLNEYVCSTAEILNGSTD